MINSFGTNKPHSQEKERISQIINQRNKYDEEIYESMKNVRDQLTFFQQCKNDQRGSDKPDNHSVLSYQS